jgi:hypothetical protein
MEGCESDRTQYEEIKNQKSKCSLWAAVRDFLSFMDTTLPTECYAVKHKLLSVSIPPPSHAQQHRSFNWPGFPEDPPSLALSQSPFENSESACKKR